MNFIKRNWAFILVAFISLALGVITLLTVVRLRQETPVAPTAPTPERAVEGSPVPECQTSFTVTVTLASPSPTPTATPGTSPTPTPTPTPTPRATPSPTPKPSASPSPTPTPTPGIGGPNPSPSPTPTPTPGGSPAPHFSVEKDVNRTTASPGDTLTYTVRLINDGVIPIYDVYFDEDLSDFVDYKAPSMSCLFKDASTGSSNTIGFEIDNLSDGVDQTPEAESSSLDRFRVAGDLTEANNTWDLDVNDTVTCTYQVTVNSGVPGGTNIINLIVGHADDKNGDQPNETELTDSDQTTVVVPPAPSVIPGVPVAGTSWPTIFLIIGGFALLILGFALP